jgi:hypothetical protein
MLSADRLTLAIEIHSRGYKLLRWVAKAIREGFIPATRAHEYADVSDGAFDWIDQHYRNIPPEARPDRQYLREFSNYFATYVTSSFDIIDEPRFQRHSPYGCCCPLCSYLVKSPYLRTKKLTKRNKHRATDLMTDRIVALALEEGISLQPAEAMSIVETDVTRRSAGYSAYGYWLIKRTEGHSDGKSILALWREIAWNRTGSPIQNFMLEYKDFVDAEESLIDAMRTATNSHGATAAG